MPNQMRTQLTNEQNAPLKANPTTTTEDQPLTFENNGVLANEQSASNDALQALSNDASSISSKNSQIKGQPTDDHEHESSRKFSNSPRSTDSHLHQEQGEIINQLNNVSDSDANQQSINQSSSSPQHDAHLTQEENGPHSNSETHKRVKKRMQKQNQRSLNSQTSQKQIRSNKEFEEDNQKSSIYKMVMSTNVQDLVDQNFTDSLKPHGPDVQIKNGRWSKDEHFRFLVALKIHGKEWKRVQEHVGSRTSTQARSHAQKFFNKLEKRKLTLVSFLDSLDINNLEDHYIMSDADDDKQPSGTNNGNQGRKKNKTLSKKQGTNSRKQSCVSKKEGQQVDAANEIQKQESSSSVHQVNSEYSEANHHAKEGSKGSSKKNVCFQENEIQQLGLVKPNFSDDKKNMKSTEEQDQQQKTNANRFKARASVNNTNLKALQAMSTQMLGKRSHSKSFSNNKFIEPMPPNSGDTLVRTTSRQMINPQVPHNDMYKSQSAVTMADTNMISSNQQLRLMSKFNSTKNIQTDIISQIASNASMNMEKVDPLRIMRANSQHNMSCQSNAGGYYNQGLNYHYPPEQPHTPSIRPTYKGFSGQAFNDQQPWYGSKQRANSVDEFETQNLLDKHEDFHVHPDHEKPKVDENQFSNINIGEYGSYNQNNEAKSRKKIVTPKLVRPSIYTVYPDMELNRQQFCQIPRNQDDIQENQIYQQPSLASLYTNFNYSSVDPSGRIHHQGNHNHSKSQVILDRNYNMLIDQQVQHVQDCNFDSMQPHLGHGHMLER